MTSFLDMRDGRDHVSGMTPEIRIVILNTTGPTADLRVEFRPRTEVLAFHGLIAKQKSPPRRTGRAKSPELLRG